MNSGLYAAFAGLVARTQAFELAANNLANLSTPGYKGQREFYQMLTAVDGAAAFSPLNRAINGFGVLGGGAVDLRPGSMETTGADLDVAIEGPGFFPVQTAAGVRYTRNGNFRLSTEGELITQTGDRVLGEQGPIRIPSGPVAISPDGTISVGGAVAGRLGLVEFPPETALRPEGFSYFSAPDGAAAAAVDSRVRQGALEGSNVDPATGGVSLILMQRNVEMLQRALSIFHNEFNRISAESLPRV